jgi:gamma-glutamylcyclotransferase (GGCT)/AIG2-like uncharacterized protein YtfP
MPQIFVYGTLKPGEAYYETYCQPHVVATVPALTQGRLFHLPQGYPALTVGTGWVTGALLQFPDASAIAQMDAFEDYHPHLPDDENQYVRQLHPIFSLHHEPLGTAWMYIMSPQRVQQYHGILLPEGVWSQQQWPSIRPGGVRSSEFGVRSSEFGVRSSERTG